MSRASVTLSSVGTSTPIALDWRGAAPISALATLGSSTITVDFTVQYTLDDLQLSSAPVWISAGSSTGSSATHFSSASFDAGISLGFTYPIAALRISSTALSGSAITLKVLQGEGW